MKRKFRYYLCQIVGWGGFLIAPWMIWPGGMERPLVMVVTGLLTTHLLRHIIIRYGWLSLPLRKAWPRLLAGAIVAAMVIGSITRIYSYVYAGDVYEGLTPRFFLAGMIDLLVAVGPWTMIYYLYHYAEKVSWEASRNRKLEMRVKEMEERSRESGTDMAAMMDSLQRIQASIVEDPVRCREEITEFSKLLREGYLKTG